MSTSGSGTTPIPPEPDHRCIAAVVRSAGQALTFLEIELGQGTEGECVELGRAAVAAGYQEYKENDVPHIGLIVLISVKPL